MQPTSSHHSSAVLLYHTCFFKPHPFHGKKFHNYIHFLCLVQGITGPGPFLMTSQAWKC